MSWQSKVMPDDAPELAGSLVGTMLQGCAGNSQPSPNQRQIRSSGEDDAKSPACHQTEKPPMNLRLCLYSLWDTGCKLHAQDYMRSLGINCEHATPQSIADQWWFWNCTNVPDPLPAPLTKLEITPHEAMRYGLSKELADELSEDTMLQAGETGEITGDGTGEALPDMDAPLWKVVEHAGSNERGTPRDAIAAEIEVVRDWLFLRTCHSYHSLEVRDLLTEQARIARGEE